MSKPVVAFLNFPWWSLGHDGNLRRGVRAGSRWPFSEAASYLPDRFQIGAYMPYPAFLGSAAAWVQAKCPEVEVILRDSIARGESYGTFTKWWDSVAERLTHVVMETGAASWEHDRRIITALKASVPDLKVAVGGPPARDLSKRDAGGLVDAWLLGEMEKPAARFVNGESGIIGFDMLTRDELRTVPFPLYDEPAAHLYFDACPKGQAWPHLQLWASRGCSYKCSFCAWPGTMTSDDPLGYEPRSVRFYDPKWIEAFIRARMADAQKRPDPLRSVYFDDDCFNLSNKHVLAICEVMKRIGLPWFAMCRVDTSTREVWQAMKDSGCAGVKVGFESASQRVIDEVIHKKLDVKKGEETCRWLRRIGLSVHTTWAVGSPGETGDEQRFTLDTIRRFTTEGVHDTYQLSGIAEIPGTPLANGPHNDPNYVSSPDGVLKAEGLLR